MSSNLPSTKRTVQIILKKFHKLEAIWDKPDYRKHEISKLKHFLLTKDKDPEKNLKFITRLHKHIHTDMSLQELWNLIVPVEREHSKQNITDEDFMITTEDQGTVISSRMPASVVLDNIRSSFNVGGIFRTADCAGFNKVYLAGYSATPEQPKVQKSSMGAHESIEWEKHKSIAELIKHLRNESTQIIALETVTSASAPETAAFKFPCSVILGNERFGLDKEILQRADTIIKIPVYGTKNSLNVVSAFSICAYEIRKQWENSKAQTT